MLLVIWNFDLQGKCCVNVQPMSNIHPAKRNCLYVDEELDFSSEVIHWLPFNFSSEVLFHPSGSGVCFALSAHPLFG